MVIWSLTVSPETDQRLRAFLEQNGIKTGNLSQYVEEAVKQRLNFEETVDRIQSRNLRFSEATIEASINEAIRETRATSRS